MNTLDSTLFSPLIFVLLIWSLFWKGLALWRAARNNQRNWFIVFVLPINTAGVLEIAYLFFFSKDKLKINDLKFWEKIQLFSSESKKTSHK